MIKVSVANWEKSNNVNPNIIRMFLEVEPYIYHQHFYTY